MKMFRAKSIPSRLRRCALRLACRQPRTTMKTHIRPPTDARHRLSVRERPRLQGHVLKVVKYKELYDNLGDEDRSALHKYAREKSESLRVSLKRAREAE